MADLKPCPFCGGEGCGGTYGDMQQCARCGAECGFDENDKQNWNRRPLEDAKDAAIERMRGLLGEANPWLRGHSGNIKDKCGGDEALLDDLMARIEAELEGDGDD